MAGASALLFTVLVDASIFVLGLLLFAQPPATHTFNTSLRSKRR